MTRRELFKRDASFWRKKFIQNNTFIWKIYKKRRDISTNIYKIYLNVFFIYIYLKLTAINSNINVPCKNVSKVSFVFFFLFFSSETTYSDLGTNLLTKSTEYNTHKTKKFWTAMLSKELCCLSEFGLRCRRCDLVTIF